MRIFKYEIEVAEPGGNTATTMDPNAKFLSLQVQGEKVVSWWAVDEDAPTEFRLFSVRPTGAKATAGWWFVETFQAGWFVGHVFTDRPFDRMGRG